MCTKFLAALLAVMMIFGTFAASAAGFADITLESDPEAYMNALLLNQMGQKLAFREELDVGPSH